MGSERRGQPDGAWPDGRRQCELHPVLQKSDLLIGYMGYFEADKGRVGFYLDTVWARLGFASSTTSSRNPIAGLQVSTSRSTAVTYHSFAIIEAGGLTRCPLARVAWLGLVHGARWAAGLPATGTATST